MEKAHLLRRQERGAYRVEEARKEGAYRVEEARKERAYRVEEAGKEGAYPVEEAGKEGAYRVEEAGKEARQPFRRRSEVKWRVARDGAGWEGPGPRSKTNAT